MEKIVSIILTALALACLNSGKVFSQQPAYAPTAYEDQSQGASARNRRWTEDLDFLALELPKKHANLFHAISARRFAAEIARLKALVPALQDFEIEVRLQQILARVGDAHTLLDLPPITGHLPVMLYQFPEGIFVIHAAPQYADLIGARLLRIGEQDVRVAYRRVATLVSKDRGAAAMERDTVPFYLGIPEVLAALGISKSPATVEMLFRSSDRRLFRRVFSKSLTRREYLQFGENIPD